MKAQIAIVPNCHAWTLRRTGEIDDRGRAVVRRVRHHKTHNLITTVGLAAWAYNLINSDGQVITDILIGDSATAPALSDTALGNLLHTFATTTAGLSRMERYAVGPVATFVFWLIGEDMTTVGTDTIKEVGLRTTNSGATASSNKLVNRGVFDEPIETSTADYIVFVINLTVKGIESSNQTWTDFGLHFVASRMVDLTLFNPIDRVAFGTGVETINAREADTATTAALWNETHRTNPTYTRDAARVLCGDVIALAAANDDIKEMGPAIDVTASQRTLLQDRGAYTADNATYALDYLVELQLVNT